jgi:sugar phosphate isomerase/epimerase
MRGARIESMNRRSFLVSLGAAMAAAGKAGNVELGVCTSTDNLAKVEQWGFDYIEPSASVVSALSEREYAKVRDAVLASRLRCRSFNGLIRTLKVVGADANLDAVSNYLDLTLERCKELGARIAVWGSASSRNIPEGRTKDQTWAEIKVFLARAGEIAKAKGLVIAIEPLRKQESNIINSGADALRLVEEVKHPNVKMIIDYYHMRVENEDPEILVKAREHIVHMHFANPTGRKWPHSADEDAEYGRFFGLMKQIGYSGGLSIEGNGSFEADGEASMAFFRGELS